MARKLPKRKSRKTYGGRRAVLQAVLFYRRQKNRALRVG